MIFKLFSIELYILHSLHIHCEFVVIRPLIKLENKLRTEPELLKSDQEKAILLLISIQHQK